MPSTEADIRRHTSLVATTFPLGPLLGQIQADIDQGVFRAGDVSQVDADLAVVDLAQPAAPLSLHAHRFTAFFGESRGVEHEHAIGLAQFRSHLPCQFGQQGPMVPVGLADELLQALALAVVQVGDGFDILAAQVGQKSLDVVVGVGLLPGRLQGLEEGLEEGLQSWQHAPEQVGRDVGIVEQFRQADTKSSFHRRSPFSGFRSPKEGYIPRSCGRAGPGHSRINELLVQYPREGRRKLGQVVPDNRVVICDKPIDANGSYDLTEQTARPFWMLEYVSKHNKRKDYEDNFEKYEKELKVPYFLLFYPETHDLTLYHHTGEKYAAVAPDENGRYPIPELELELGLHDGWVRFWFRGELLPLPADLRRAFRNERQRAETAEGVCDELHKQLDQQQQQVEQERQARLALEREIDRLKGEASP